MTGENLNSVTSFYHLIMANFLLFPFVFWTGEGASRRDPSSSGKKMREKKCSLRMCKRMTQVSNNYTG